MTTKTQGIRYFQVLCIVLVACGDDQRSFTGIEIDPAPHALTDVQACLGLFFAEAEVEFPDVRGDLADYGVRIEFNAYPLNCGAGGCASPDGYIEVIEESSLCNAACGAVAHELYHVVAWMYGVSSLHKDHQGMWWGTPYEQTAQFRIQRAFTNAYCAGDTSHWL